LEDITCLSDGKTVKLSKMKFSNAADSRGMTLLLIQDSTLKTSLATLVLLTITETSAASLEIATMTTSSTATKILDPLTKRGTKKPTAVMT
jgi:hypothetical protein